MDEKIAITVQTIINVPVTKVWKLYISPEHVTQWNNASGDWCTPRAENDLRVGGKFLFRMEAKNGSSGFDFEGTYDEVKDNEFISYTIIDGRKVKIIFSSNFNATIITQTFEAENINPIEMQKAGWQAILNNFKKYVEANTLDKCKIINMPRVSTYLNFSRNTEQAFNFYRSVFGGEFIGGIARFKDIPYHENMPPLSETDKNLVMHIALPILCGHILMGTDAPESMGFKLNIGNNVYINLEPDTKEETQRLFAALSENGKIEMKLQDMFWGAYYGSCKDKFGVQWMFNYVEKKNINKIIPCLWFDNQAEEAAHFYISVFNNSKIRSLTHYNEAGYDIHGKESGTVMTVDFEIENQKFLALNGGPHFKFNPSISFFISCQTKEEVDILWKKLIENGKALMPLDSYPFSERYGWLQDKYGVSWQIMFMGSRETKQKIIPTFMFVSDICGKAEEAINHYASIFNNSKVSNIVRYSKDNLPDKEGTITHASFMIEKQWFAAMDSAHVHNFAFNEAISFIVKCDAQTEIDYYSNQLSAFPDAEQCGWLKDKYGIFWQIVPAVMDKMLQDKDAEKVRKLTEAFLTMKRFDIQKLNELYI